MKRKFIETSRFRKEWENSGLDESDFREFQLYFLANTEVGSILTGCGGIKKVRWYKKGTGKSGGIRIFFLDLKSHEVTYLLALIEKSDSENLNRSERNLLKQWVDTIKEKHRE